MNQRLRKMVTLTWCWMLLAPIPFPRKRKGRWHEKKHVNTDKRRSRLKFDFLVFCCVFVCFCHGKMCSVARSLILLCFNLIGLLCCRQQIGINWATHGGLFTATDATVLNRSASIAGSWLDRAFALARIRWEVGLVEETGKQDKVAEIHCNG